MTRQRSAGYEEARDAGLLASSPDIRIALAMSGFSAAATAVNVADITLDEYDGVGYVRHDATGVAVGYDSGSDEWRITCTNGSGEEFGTPVAAGSGAPTMLVIILYVDGTDANDYVLGWSDEGTFAQGNGSGMGLTLPNDVIFASANA